MPILHPEARHIPRSSYPLLALVADLCPGLQPGTQASSLAPRPATMPHFLCGQSGPYDDDMFLLPALSLPHLVP